MSISEILKERSSGYLQIHTCNRHDVSLKKTMGFFGLSSNPEFLEECDIDYAVEVIKTILWKDLAYSHEMIQEDVAFERAQYLVKQFSSIETKLFTNGNWKNYHINKSTSFNPLTEATFDAGVLFLNPNYSACIWVKDED